MKKDNKAKEKKIIKILLIAVIIFVVIFIVKTKTDKPLAAEFDYIGNLEHGLAKVKLDNKYGYVNKKNGVVIPIIYDDGMDFSRGSFSYITQRGTDAGNIYSTSDTFNSFDRRQRSRSRRRDYITKFSYTHELAGVKLDGKWGFIDKKGNAVLPIIYDEVEPFKEEKEYITANYSFVKIKLDGKYGLWGLIANTLNKYDFTVPIKYDEMDYIDEGIIKVKLDNRWGIIDKTDRIVVPIQYEEIGEVGDFFPITAKLKLNNKWGLMEDIDMGNIIVIPFEYDDVDFFDDQFENELAQVSINNKWGFIDRDRKKVIPIIYDYAHYFFGGNTIRVLLENKWGVIDDTGKILVPIIYDELWYNTDDLMDVKLNNRWGRIDKTNRSVIPIAYDTREDLYAN